MSRRCLLCTEDSSNLETTMTLWLAAQQSDTGVNTPSKYVSLSVVNLTFFVREFFFQDRASDVLY
jgi:hypothetical protein